MSKRIYLALTVVTSVGAISFAVVLYGRPDNGLSNVLSMAALTGNLWLAIAVHELGHALAGRTQGFVFRLLAVGPLWIERSADGQNAVRFNWDLVSWGGRTRSFPSDTGNLVNRYAIFVAGGPLASAFLALAAWGLKVICHPGWLHDSFASLSMLSLLVFIGTALPFAAGLGVVSDGDSLRRLAGPLAARDASLLATAGAICVGRRPRDWPAETVEQALAPSDGSLSELVALTRAVSYAMDCGERAQASALASRAWELAKKYPRQLGFFAIELILVAALEGDATKAREALMLVRAARVEEYIKLWAEAEVAALDGSLDVSREKARAGLAALDEAGFVTPSARDRERLQALAASELHGVLGEHCLPGVPS